MKSRNSFLAKLSSRSCGESGVTTIEYAIMLVLVGVAVSAFGLGLGGSVNSVFSRMIQGLADERSKSDDIPEEDRGRQLDHEIS